MKFLLQTQIGVEDITELELEKKFKGKYSLDYIGFVPHKNGLVQVDFRSEDSLDFYQKLGSIEDAFFVLDYVGDIPNEESAKNLMKKLDIAKIKKNVDFFFDNLNSFDNKGSFRFVTRKKSVHNYRRLDLNREVKDFFDRNINRVKVTEDEGTKEIWTTLIKNRLIIAIRLTNKEKRHGYYKTATVHGSLRATVANSMAFLTDINSKDSLWDPFCGAGTIPCEISEHFKFGKLICSDISEEALAATKENLANLKSFKSTKAKISIRHEDFFDSNNYCDTLITNLPFGTQYSIDSDFEQRFAQKVQMIKNLRQITVLYPTILNIPNFQLTRKFKLQVLGRECWICVYKKM